MSKDKKANEEPAQQDAKTNGKIAYSGVPTAKEAKRASRVKMGAQLKVANVFLRVQEADARSRLMLTEIKDDGKWGATVTLMSTSNADECNAAFIRKAQEITGELSSQL